MGANGLISELRSSALDDGWERQSVPAIPEIRDPSLLAPYAHAYMGEKSLTIKDTRVRKVVGDVVSPGEVGRLYLRKVMAEGELRKIHYRREALQFTDRRPAYFFKGQTGGPFVLVDVKACYASIYSRLCLDLTYRPDTDPPLLGLGNAAFIRSSEWLSAKDERNAMWGNLLRPRVREWRHGEPVEKIPNRYFSPDLVGIVFDVAHAIAGKAVEMGALTWAVDGGAFRPEEGRGFIEWLSRSFGLIADIRAEGPGWLFGATSYSIGPVVTEDVRKGNAREWETSSNLRRVRSEWLADVMKERECLQGK